MNVNEDTVHVCLTPVCQCGYVFKELQYNEPEGFIPSCCPSCGKRIENMYFQLPNKNPNEYYFDVDEFKF